MGTNNDKSKKKLEKIEKKRIKAHYKLEKKRLEVGSEASQPEVPPVSQPKAVPWYKDPAWLRAIVGIASLIVAIISLFLIYFR